MFISQAISNATVWTGQYQAYEEYVHKATEKHLPE